MPLAAAFVGYVIFWNLALQLNTVGFYQLMKILITPAVIVLEYMWYKKVRGGPYAFPSSKTHVVQEGAWRPLLFSIL